MTSAGDIRLSGEHLATARRAASVALVIGVAADVRRDVAELLPGQSDLTRLLEVLGWPGAADAVAVLDPDDADILDRVVHATMILALEEGERGAYRALRTPDRSAETDVPALVAVHTLSGLALRLRQPELASSPVLVGRGPDGEALVSPALSALAAGITLPVWIADGDLTLEWINSALAAVLGVEAAVAAGTPWRRWCDPIDIPRVAQVVEAAALEHRNWTVEASVGAPGGPYSRLLIVAAPRFAPDGTLIGWSGICFDVTRDRRLSSRLEPMSSAVAADSAKSHLLLRQFPGMIWTTDPELRCTSIVGSGLATIGRVAEDCIGRPLADLAGVPGSIGPLLDTHTAALGGAAGFVVHDCCGRDFETHVEPLRDVRGAVVGTIGISHDITERVARDAENLRLVRQLELAQRIGRIGSWELDPRSGSFLWSDEGYRLLGYEPGAVVPSFETFIARVHPEDRDRLTTIFRERMQSGIGFQLDYRVVRTDGKLRTMRAAVEFGHDAAGEVVQVVGILQDVTAADVVTGQSVDLSALLGRTTRSPDPGSRPV